MQPSEVEIQREVEVLRDLKRRSTAPGASTIDPDLPNNSSPGSPVSGYWDTNDTVHPNGAIPGPSNTSDDTILADDPLHLFWVPAGVHPEIDPAEFRAFLKEHARSPPPEGGALQSGRSNSTASLGRKKSMLSRQYKPSENDGVENENVVPLRRNRSSLYSNPGPQLTINDLQRLEELAEEASESDDPTKLRNILRRSLSLNISPSAIDKMDDIPDMGDEADAPIIVPPPGQILRRAARTKIRKPGLPGDGGGHRFGASRRGARTSAGSAPSASIDRTSSDMSSRSSSDHGDGAEMSSAATSYTRRPISEEKQPRPDSYSEAASIYDAYADDSEEDVPAPTLVTSSGILEELTLPFLTSTETPPSLLEALAPIILPGDVQSPEVTEPMPATTISEPSISRTPSPDSSTDNLVLHQHQPPHLQSPSVSAPILAPIPGLQHQQRPPPQTHHHQQGHSGQSHRKDKDKKGLFGKWSSDKGSKKGGKERESRERPTASDKDSGFFGSLFGSKKKQDEPGQPLGHGTTTGREAAQALLGASKSSKAYIAPLSPVPTGGNPWARYPLHVERAIYRLSHIKLANPRRPLYEQVLISNLMFWYLGVINKSTATSPQPQQANAAVTPGQNQVNPEDGAAEGQDEKAQLQQVPERTPREREEEQAKQRAEAERAEKERELEAAKKKEPAKRGPLSRPPPAGSGRRAEMPVKGPQYEMQHREMEQEYGGYNSPPSSREGYAPRIHSPQPQNQHVTPDQFHYNAGMDSQHRGGGGGLPPGAMPPVSGADQGWIAAQPRSGSPRQHSSPSPPPMAGAANTPQRRSRSPPQQYIPPQSFTAAGAKQQQQIQSVGRSPSRSLSASASPPPQHQQPMVNGKLRKGVSAHAAVPQSSRSPQQQAQQRMQHGLSNGVMGEDEDVPLAVWRQHQQQHQR